MWWYTVLISRQAIPDTFDLCFSPLLIFRWKKHVVVGVVWWLLPMLVLHRKKHAEVGVFHQPNRCRLIIFHAQLMLCDDRSGGKNTNRTIFSTPHTISSQLPAHTAAQVFPVMQDWFLPPSYWYAKSLYDTMKHVAVCRSFIPGNPTKFVWYY